MRGFDGGCGCIREDTLAHMANYGMGGADGRGDQDMQQLVRNQQHNLQQVLLELANMRTQHYSAASITTDITTSAYNTYMFRA